MGLGRPIIDGERLDRTAPEDARDLQLLDSDKGAVWQSSQLLGTCMLAERTGELTYMFPAGLEERLTEPALYSYISLRVIYQFESKYALILYEILKRYADRKAADLIGPSKRPNCAIYSGAENGSGTGRTFGAGRSTQHSRKSIACPNSPSRCTKYGKAGVAGVARW